MATATPPVTATSTVTSTSSTVAQSSESFDEPIGMPPRPVTAKHEMTNAMPVAEIYPCRATWADGLGLFKLENDWPAYKAIADSVRVKVGAGPGLKVAFIPDNLPSETFGNDYGQTFLAKFADVVGDTVGDIAQMSGGRSATDMIKQSISFLQNSTNSILKGVGGFAEDAYDIAGKAGEEMKKSSNAAIRSIPAVMNSLLAGQRVDFPQVWKNSSFGCQYSLTVKLYNAFPGNKKAHERNIVAPLGALLCLMLPQGWDSAYSYPFFCQVNARGLFYLPAAGISAIAVSKGGEFSSIAYNQRISCIDVRIDFADLFSTMVVYDPAHTSQRNDFRPRLDTYLNNLRESTTVEDPTNTTPTSGGSASTTASSSTRTTSTGAPAQARAVRMDVTQNSRAAHLERTNDSASKLLRSVVRKNNH